jgi:hypothetical protein
MSLKVDEDFVDCWHPAMLLMWYDNVLTLSKTALALLATGMIWENIAKKNRVSAGLRRIR